MSALDLKMLRDLRKLWAQGLAIALVLAAGVATLVMSVGAERSLQETRTAYYERYRFADVFAAAKRAPLALEARIAAIPGVAAVETRIRRAAIIDAPGEPAPATGLFMSLPRHGEPKLNGHLLVAGREPAADARDEILANEAFVSAHGYRLGDRIDAILDGSKRSLAIVGVMMSPEYVYAIGPGDLVPDDRRFGIFAMPYEALAAAFDRDGAFDDLALALRPGASERAVIDAVDLLLAPYGGDGAHGRDDQLSHAFLEAELDQLRAMSRTIPPIFLAVAAFLVNMSIARIVALERREIGLMKAVGYSTAAVTLHYLKLVGVITFIGVLIGWAAGWGLGRWLTATFGEFYHFPFLIFALRLDVFAISAAAAFAAAFVGAAGATLRVARLAPAVAMSPPAPARYGRLPLEAFGLLARAPTSVTMALRSIARGPIRAGLTTIGLAASVAVLIGSLFGYDAVEEMIDATYFRSDRQHATVAFSDIRPEDAVWEVGRLPGVLTAEPFRLVPVRLVNGPLRERTTLYGKRADADLSRIVDADGAPVAPPAAGLALSSALATKLDAGLGDRIEVEALAGRRETLDLRVDAVVEQYVGLAAYMEIDALNRALRDGHVIDGAHVSLDADAEPALFAALKETPSISALALQRRSLVSFRETVAKNIGMMTTIYTALAATLAFGVVYNAVRIQFSERGRELASLRVLGFTRGETSVALLAELAVLALAAIPVGWVLGYGLAWTVAAGLQSDLYRVPLVIDRSTYAWATAVFLSVTAVSSLLVRRRIDRLDLVAVLKTRE
ncbi:MAG: ABC transporter permease [Pseudomonadota bacterium]